ncbi:unnamed protein product, partial [Amoebophrya sp. A120]
TGALSYPAQLFYYGDSTKVLQLGPHDTNFNMHRFPNPGGPKLSFVDPHEQYSSSADAFWFSAVVRPKAYVHKRSPSEVLIPATGVRKLTREMVHPPQELPPARPGSGGSKETEKFVLPYSSSSADESQQESVSDEDQHHGRTRKTSSKNHATVFQALASQKEDDFNPFNPTSKRRFYFALSEAAFNFLQEHDSELLSKIQHRIVVYGKVSPSGKVAVVRSLQRLGPHVVGMCGDGGNDCAAL